MADDGKIVPISPRRGHCGGNYGCPAFWNECHERGQCKGYSYGACNGFECCCYD